MTDDDNPSNYGEKGFIQLLDDLESCPRCNTKMVGHACKLKCFNCNFTKEM